MNPKRNPRKAAVAASALAATLFLALPGSASALTIGETFVPTSNCASDSTFIQSGSPGPQYTAPSAGVITSWSFRASDSPPQQMKFKVGRPAPGADLSADAEFTIIGEDGPVTPTASQLNTYATQIPVQAGDMIGLYTGTLLRACARVAPGFRDHIAPEDVMPGESRLFFDESGFQFDVSANLETQKCANRAPTIAGTDGDDSLTGTNGDDVIVGLGGDDVIGAAGGEDCLAGNAGKDVLRGGAGHDLALGGGGNDKLRGQNGRDKLKGHAGKDKLNGGNGKDKLKGGPGKDKLRGAGAKDKIKGNGGNDKVGAQDGKKDRINCGGGNDRAVVDPIDKVKNCETVKVVDAD